MSTRANNNTSLEDIVVANNETKYEMENKIVYKERITSRSTQASGNTFWKKLKGKVKGRKTSENIPNELVELINLSPQGPIYYYCKNQILGQGGFGKVFKGFACQNKTFTPVAIKTGPLSDVMGPLHKVDHLGEIPSEVFFLKQLPNHQAAIKFHHYQKLNESTYAIVMERPENSKDLQELRGERYFPFSEKKAKKIIRNIASLLKQLEEMNIVHGDLKVNNVVYDLDNHVAKLVDYGLAYYFEDNKFLETFRGTESYMPPEVILHGKYYPPHATVWCLGLITYYCLTGCKPYRDVKEAIVHSAFRRPPEHMKNFSSNAQDIIEGMLFIDHLNRLDLDDILNHPWITERRFFSLF